MNGIDLKLKSQTFLHEPVKPIFYYLKNNDHRIEFESLLKDEKTKVFDHIYGQLKELIKILHPKKRLAPQDYEQLINDHIAGTSLLEYGVWVYYPWSCNLIHILDREEFINLRTAANRQKITFEERDILATKKVGIIGLSVGQSVAMTLALERGCGELRIADFDTIELNNLNRLRTGLQNLGLKKAYCVAREIAEIDPFFHVVCFTDGVTEDNIDDFFTRDGKLDLVIDECDGVDVKIRCRLKAKSLGVPVLMEASDRGTVDVERFDLDPKRPIMHGWLEHLSLDLNFLKTLKTSEEKLPYILPIAGLETLSPRMKASMLEIEQTITTWPQLASAVALGGAVTADTCRRIFLNQYTASGRYFIDLEKLIPDERIKAEKHEFQHLDPISDEEIGAIVEKYKMASPADTLSADPGKAKVSQLVEAAITAPTGGNAQPWKWHYTDKQLFLFLSPHYAPRMIDFGNTATFVGFGAAAENLILRAQQEGLEVVCNKYPFGEGEKLVAVFSFYDPATRTTQKLEAHDPLNLGNFIEKRVVNRNIGERKIIEPSLLEEMATAVRAIPGADLDFVTSPEAIENIGEVMAMADRMRVMNKDGHLEFLAETKWTPEEALKSRRGVDINTLDLTPGEMTGFKIVSNWDVVKHLNDWKGGAGLEKLTKKAASAASAVGLVTMPSYNMENIFDGGRALERAWLAATKLDIAFQPISISVFIFHRKRNEGLHLFPEHIQNEILEMRKKFETTFPCTRSRCEILLFRVFLSSYPEKRSLRTGVEEILSFR